MDINLEQGLVLYLVYLLPIDDSSNRKASGKSNKSVLKHNCSISTDSNKHLQNRTVIYEPFVYERSVYSFRATYQAEIFQFLRFVLIHEYGKKEFLSYMNCWIYILQYYWMIIIWSVNLWCNNSSNHPRFFSGRKDEHENQVKKNQNQNAIASVTRSSLICGHSTQIKVSIIKWI